MDPRNVYGEESHDHQGDGDYLRTIKEGHYKPQVGVPQFSYISNQSCASTSYISNQNCAAISYNYFRQPQIDQSQYYPNVHCSEFVNPSLFPSIDQNGLLPTSSMGFFHRGFHSQRQIIATRHRFVDSSCRIQRPRRWGPSVTKAARIKRKMVRQRSLISARLGLLSDTNAATSTNTTSAISLSSSRKQPLSSTPTNQDNADVYTLMTPDNKRLKFILQKELKNSDVNSLGRIVLPKKDSEAHLPSLTVKEGIQIAVREVLSPKVWFMRYRFWPNNKSRMYVLENTGEYVKQNELKCGDFVILYQDENKQLYISFQKAQRPTLEGEPNKEEKESRTGLEREHESPHAEVEDQRLLISEDMLRQQGIGFHEPSTSSNTLAVEGDLFCLDGTIYLDLSNCNLSELDILPNFDDSDLSLYDDLIDDFNQDFGTAKADPSKTAK
ncbi:hypothetical protein C5167_009034 [Papaver somniferum]|uniref:TF-B3 domain-containing protein n=2 Tax=Papaver somniferum TaxID=3469 RepID=A0A4Y7JZ52_PAPSO|nr:hypothetical protein C5167_009034 [Papaver somniferum]